MRLASGILIATFALALAGTSSAQPLEPDIMVTKVIDAPVADVWKAWTTVEGIESFFAPKAAKVVPEPGGAFELWFGVRPEVTSELRALIEAELRKQQN